MLNFWKNTLRVMNNTKSLTSATKTYLEPHVLAASTQAAAEAFTAAGTAANTVRSYRCALAYWDGWLQLRYGRTLGDGALPVPVVVQFICDHLARPTAEGISGHLLPTNIDLALCEAKIKTKPGPLACSTVSHRLAVLATWHKLNQWENPCVSPGVSTLLRDARKAQFRQGISVRKKTAITLEPLQAMLATCTDGLRGVREWRHQERLLFWHLLREPLLLVRLLTGSPSGDLNRDHLCNRARLWLRQAQRDRVNFEAAEPGSWRWCDPTRGGSPPFAWVVPWA